MIEERFFNCVWRFCPDPDNLGIDQQWMLQENQPYLEEKSRIIVPSCWNRRGSSDFSDYVGVAWYWRVFRIPPHCQDKPTKLIFEGVAHAAQVFIDGEEINNFVGGFIPFEIDISNYIDDKDHFLAVRVDNSPEIKGCLSIPDTDSYGGIYKPVKLISEEYIIVEERSIETTLKYSEINGKLKNAELTLSLYLKNRSDFDVKGKLSVAISRDYVPVVEIVRDVEILKQNSRLSKILLLLEGDDLELWEPDSPNLYNLKIVCSNEELGEIFRIEDIIGIREIEVSSQGLILNNKPIELKGLVFPVDLPEYGYAIPDFIIHDMLCKVKNNGYNIICPNQGVFDRTLIELASRVGLLVINHIPIMSLTLSEKQNYFNLFANSITFLPALAFYSINSAYDLTEHQVRKDFEDIQKLFTNRLDPSRYMVDNGNFSCEKWDKWKDFSQS